MSNRKRVRGFTNIEVFVSAGLLLTAIATLSLFVPRLGNIWRVTRNDQLATHELANQLEVLTAIPELQLSQALESLQVASELTNSLPNAVLSHQLLDDEHGRRIVLSIKWDRVADAKPISMVAWLPSQKQDGQLTGKNDAGGTP
jgi:hypothetical protein